jgi:hypothetical protein
MGQKHAFQRQHLFFRAAHCLILLVALTGCRYMPEPVRPADPLARANHYLNQGDFTAAMQESRYALQNESRYPGDKALFMMGLIYAHPDYDQHDDRTARDTFHQIVRRFPDSDYQAQAKLWILTLTARQEAEERLNVKSREVDNLKAQIARHQEEQDTAAERCRKSLKARDEQIEQLKQSIDRLKEVDIRLEEKKRKTAP